MFLHELNYRNKNNVVYNRIIRHEITSAYFLR